MNRRAFLRGVAAAGVGSLLAGLPRVGQGTTRALNPGQTWVGEVPVTLPSWPYYGNSFAADTVLMFRGNPAHTFYGTGPLRANLEILWSFRTEDYGTQLRGEDKVWSGTGWTGQASHYGGYVFFGSQDRHLYCLRASDGLLMWKYRAGRMFKGSLCIYKNRIYAPNVDNCIHCLDAATGKLLWKFNTGNDCDSSPCVLDYRLYVAGESGFVRCIDPEAGAELWKFKVGGTGPETKSGSNGAEGSVAIDGNQLVVGNYFGDVHCIDIVTHKLLWKMNTGDDTDASAVFWGDYVYVAAEEASSQIFCLNRKDGSVKWKLKAGRGWYSTPALVDGRFYIAGNDGKAYCLDATTGAELWKTPLAAASWNSPVVVDGRVLVGSYGNFLHILDSKSGAELQAIDLGGRCHSAPCVVDGKVYVGSAGGRFFGLG